MTLTQKQNLIAEIAALLQAKLELDIKVENAEPLKSIPNNSAIEMLTIKESVKAVSGVSEHTIRQLITQGKLPFIRTGQGTRQTHE